MRLGLARVKVLLQSTVAAAGEVQSANRVCEAATSAWGKVSAPAKGTATPTRSHA